MIPPRHYTIRSGGKRTLYVTWNALTWKNVVITLDGKEIDAIKNGARELSGDGREYHLPGGALLQVQAKGSLIFKDLHVHIDGEPIPNTAADPDVKIRRAANGLFFIGAFDVILGFMAGFGGDPILASLGFGWATVALGMVLFSLAFLVRKASLTALAIAIGLYLLDTFLGLYLTSQAGFELETGIVVARLLLLISMIPAIPAIQTVNAAENGS